MIHVTIVVSDGSRETYPMEHLPQAGDRLYGFCGRACIIVRDRSFTLLHNGKQEVLLRCD